jgi:hypothetical protein
VCAFSFATPALLTCPKFSDRTKQFQEYTDENVKTVRLLLLDLLHELEDLIA